MRDEDRIFLAVGGLIVLALFLLPAYVALRRGHRNAPAVLVLNLCLAAAGAGAAFYPWPDYVKFAVGAGWVAALVWSLTDSEPPTYRRRNS